VYASRPPAEPPTQTIGKSLATVFGVIGKLSRTRRFPKKNLWLSYRFHFADYECRAGKATNEANRLRQIGRLYNVLKERRKMSLVELSILKQAETLSLEKSGTC
jgi:hypothetical protein